MYLYILYIILYCIISYYAILLYCIILYWIGTRGVHGVTAFMVHWLDSLRGSSVKIVTMQRRLAWPLRKDDTHTSRSVNNGVKASVLGASRVTCNPE